MQHQAVRHHRLISFSLYVRRGRRNHVAYVQARAQPGIVTIHRVS